MIFDFFILIVTGTISACISFQIANEFRWLKNGYKFDEIFEIVAITNVPILCLCFAVVCLIYQKNEIPTELFIEVKSVIVTHWFQALSSFIIGMAFSFAIMSKMTIKR